MLYLGEQFPSGNVRWGLVIRACFLFRIKDNVFGGAYLNLENFPGTYFPFQRRNLENNRYFPSLGTQW